MTKTKRKSGGTKGIDWQEYRQKIIEGLNLETEFNTLGIEVVGTPGDDGWAGCRAVDRDDHQPSAAVNFQTGHYIDKGGVGLSLSFFDLAAHVKKFPSWKIARDHYAAVAGVAIDGRPPRDPAEHLVFMPWNAGTENLAALWAAKKSGVTVESIQAAGGRIARYRDQYTVVALPCYGPGLTAADPVGWVLWNSTGRDLPVFRGRDKASSQLKTTWVKMKTTFGSDASLIGRHGIERIQRAASGDKFVIWKVEGPSDLLALWAIIPAEKRDRHLVITNAGGGAQNPASWMAAIFAGHLCATVGDGDATGIAGSIKWAKWIAKVADESRLLRPEQMGFEVVEKHGQDLRDWIAGKAITEEPAGNSEVTAV